MLFLKTKKSLGFPSCPPSPSLYPHFPLKFPPGLCTNNVEILIHRNRLENVMFRNKCAVCFDQKEKILSERGFEPLPSDEDQKSHTPYQGARCYLESGALDHSAILTCRKLTKNLLIFKTIFVSSSSWICVRNADTDLNEEKWRP